MISVIFCTHDGNMIKPGTIFVKVWCDFDVVISLSDGCIDRKVYGHFQEICS